MSREEAGQSRKVDHMKIREDSITLTAREAKEYEECFKTGAVDLASATFFARTVLALAVRMSHEQKREITILNHRGVKLDKVTGERRQTVVIMKPAQAEDARFLRRLAAQKFLVVTESERSIAITGGRTGVNALVKEAVALKATIEARYFEQSGV